MPSQSKGVRVRGRADAKLALTPSPLSPRGARSHGWGTVRAATEFDHGFRPGNETGRTLTGLAGSS
eukprot:6172345-Pleurochrysis_carterae.AAC.5